MVEIIPNWHPFLVHFTLALNLSAALFLVAGKAAPGAAWSRGMITAGLWNLWLGAAVTVLTYFAGRYAFSTVTHDDPSHLAMIVHKQWGSYTALGFGLLAAWSAMARRKGRPVGWLFLGFLVMASGALMTTGYKGAELVYRHGLGVMSLPEADDHHHDAGATGEAHDHDADHDHDHDGPDHDGPDHDDHDHHDDNHHDDGAAAQD